MSLQDIKDAIKAEQSRAYKLKTKKAKEKAWAKVREMRREALQILYKAAKKHGAQSMKGIVKCFRPYDDRFLVSTPYGTMWLSPTADVNAKSWYSHTCCIEYDEGQEIIIEFATEVNHEGLFLEIKPGETSGGRVNEEQYAELCKRDDLAFFKYPNSDGVTGLFSNKKRGA